MSENELEQLEPEQVLQIYVDDCRQTAKIADSTEKSIRSRVGMFVEWCDEDDIDTLSELRGMNLHQWRLETTEGIAERTLCSRLSSVRIFLRWTRRVDAVDEDLPEKIDVPDV